MSIRKSSGFSLLEIMMAMAILATALVLLANSWSAGFARVKKTQVNFEIASLLERKMNEYERRYKGKPLAEIADSEEDNFGDLYPQYTWKMESRKFEFPDISSTLSAREGGVDEMTVMVIKKLTDHLSQTIKELKVTVTYKAAKRPVSVSATQYFVDYDKPLNMGLPGQ